MVVAPTTAVPISTGLEVALKVLPAPSFSSRLSLAFSNLRLEAELSSGCPAPMPGMVSIVESS